MSSNHYIIGVLTKIIKNCLSVNYTLLVSFCICLCLNTAISQQFNLGSPPLENFDKSQYSAGHQNWAIMHHNGRLFSANNSGLLLYDGIHWNTLATPKNTILRSLATDGKEKIFIGGQGELGCFEPNDQGHLEYHSFIDQIASSNSNVNFEEIWQLEFVDGVLYAHVSPNEILMFQNGKSQFIKTKSIITDMVKVNETIFIHLSGKGLHKLENGVPELLKGSDLVKDYEVVDVLAYDDGMLIITAYHGMYYYNKKEIVKWNSNADQFLKLNQARCGFVLSTGELLVGTHLGGLVKIRKDKRANLILNKGNGLQSNSINDICLAEDGSLWIATISGLDRIDLMSSYDMFYPDGELEGAVYDIEFWNNRIYFCTANGVYHIEEREYYNPFEESEFALVAGSIGQSYSLDIINGELFCGHHKGAFKINRSNKFVPLLKEVGAWKFVSLDERSIALGTYKGVYVLTKNKQNHWEVKHKVNGFEESSRVMLLDKHQHLWVSHPYKYVYRIDFNENFTESSLKEYDSEDGFQTNNRNYVFPYKRECILTNNTGVYKYDEATDTFIVAEEFKNDYPSGLHVRSILELGGETWIISDKGTDRLTSNTDEGSKFFDILPLIPGRTDEHYIGGFENLYPVDTSTILICSEKGVKLFSGPSNQSNSSAPIITSISIPSQKDSIVYGGFGSYTDFALSKEMNDINFEFTSSNALKPIQFYRYRLEGLDKKWSVWTGAQTKEYSNLDPGEYVFNVRAVNYNSSETEITKVPFSIQVPWYQTVIAYSVYAFLFLLLLLGLLLIPRQKYKETTAKLTAEKEKTEADLIEVKAETERNIEKIKREKLQSEIAFKNKELAMSTMYLLQKNQTLAAIRTKVEDVGKSVKDTKAKQELRKVANLLRSDIQLDDEWQNFSVHFDQVHHNFLKRLKTKFPMLTPNDQKLSAYLRMNLNTKEIAPLLKISVRGVEIARYRLRKKLEISKAENLNDFMMSF